MWKKIGIGILLLLILIAGAGYYLFSHLDSLIEAAIEKYGSEATQTSVQVGGVSLSLTSGSGSISNLTVANPPGYSGTSALSLGSIAMQLDTGSLPGNGPIVIDEVAITQPQITYEVRGLDRGSNLVALQDNIQSFTSSGGTAQPPTQSGPPARKEIIRDLTITGGLVSVRAELLNGRGLTVPLPPIHLINLGGEGGATPAQIGVQVLSTMTRAAARTGEAALRSRLDDLGAVPSKAGGLLHGLFGT